MKRFFILISSSVIILAAVFLYAQAKRDDTTVIDINKILTKQPEGKILGAEDKNIKTNRPATPINLKIDKNPVNLYWPQKITIQTTPNIEVRVKVTYPNGSLNNSGTKSGMSDDKGIFEVNWTIKGKKEILGIAEVNVSVGGLESYAENISSFEIVEYKKTPSPIPVVPPATQLPNPAAPSY